ncbi:MAG: glutathione S-transferase N-terminal domain-containing protein [Deltaproteobacteria bacterium]|nr:glutathione S-transferase N-terminal domain-containing protein [Deltaproteobacteria bacterium]MBW2361717.1 glutathione S-transferase N-terminal domain-containing protein [Deltaproteobacteria bacterium]
MIELHTFPTPNSFKVSIALEEMELPYEIHSVNIARGEQFEPKFLAISPNNRIPAIVDRDPIGGGEAISLFESGAILQYLAEKSGRFVPGDLRGRLACTEWLFWQMAGLGPMVGQAGHFRNYAPEKIEYGITRYTNEAARLYGVMDKRLADHEFLADEYSIADMACWPWIDYHDHHGQKLEDFPNVGRWHTAIDERPGTQRGKVAGAELAAGMSQGLDEEAKRILFGHGKK